MKRTLLAALVLPFILVMLNAQALIFSPSLYDALQQESSVDNEEARQLTRDLIEYFQHPGIDDPSLDILTLEESSHIRDVKLVIHLLIGGLLVSILLFLYAWNMLDGRLTLAVGSILTILTIGIGALIPFDMLFTEFHLVFFAPGTWTFPASSALIQAYPFEFFYLFTRRVLGQTLLVASGILLFIGAKKISRLYHNKA